jgi:hypothetical protein
MAILNFDSTNVPQSESMDAIPAGWYNAAIDQSEMKPTKDGVGAYLETRFNVLDGQYANRKVFTRLNLRNANPVAQEIAYKQLSSICHAVGVIQVADSQQLHGLPLKIKVKVRAAQGDYEASNEISAFKNINEQVDAVGAAPAAGGGAPWASPPAAPAMALAQPAPAPAAAAPAWQAPAAQQPWAAAPAAPAPIAAAPAAAPAQPGATPPWMASAASAAAPGATPPWAAPAP